MHLSDIEWFQYGTHSNSPPSVSSPGARADAALLDFVKSGKGLVMYHFSTAAFDGWSDYAKLSTGNWRPNQWHHSARHDFKVTIKG
jgi:hypothetical protein